MNRTILTSCIIPSCLTLGVGFVSLKIGDAHVDKIEEMLRKDNANESSFTPIQNWEQQNFFKRSYTLPRWDKNSNFI